MGNDRKIVISNIDKIHTTRLGEERIKRNLKIDGEVINYVKKTLLDVDSVIYKKGKNYYCQLSNVVITINSYNYSVITAHII